MDALLMCGGKGTRLDADVEKPLFEVGGMPMVDHVRHALAESRVETTYAVVSPNAPETTNYLDGELPLIETDGDGYVTDLLTALDRVEQPVLTVAADLPLLDATVVDDVLADVTGSTSVQVPATLKQGLGVSVDEIENPQRESAWVPTGVNVVGADDDTVLRRYDARLAVNVNHERDATVAERLLAASDGTAGSAGTPETTDDITEDSDGP